MYLNSLIFSCTKAANENEQIEDTDEAAMMKPALINLLTRKKAIGLTRCAGSGPENGDFRLLVRFFGKPEMNIFGTIIQSDKISDSAAAWETLYYLNEHKYQSFNIKELAQAMLPDVCGTIGDGRRFRTKLYKLQAAFESAYGDKKQLFKDDNSTRYSQLLKFNAHIGLCFDYELFDFYIEKYNRANNDFDRLEYLQHAMDLYHGDLFGGNPVSTSLMQTINDYHRLFLFYLEKYLELLLKSGCYEKASNFSWHALTIEPDYYLLFATVYIALVRQNMRGRAWDAMTRAVSVLTNDAFNSMLEIIEKYLPEEEMKKLQIYAHECPDEDRMWK